MYSLMKLTDVYKRQYMMLATYTEIISQAYYCGSQRGYYRIIYYPRGACHWSVIKWIMTVKGSYFHRVSHSLNIIPQTHILWIRSSCCSVWYREPLQNAIQIPVYNNCPLDVFIYWWNSVTTFTTPFLLAFLCIVFSCF